MLTSVNDETRSDGRKRPFTQLVDSEDYSTFLRALGNALAERGFPERRAKLSFLVGDAPQEADAAWSLLDSTDLADADAVFARVDDLLRIGSGPHRVWLGLVACVLGRSFSSGGGQRPFDRASRRF
jgi:hypothetical protein